MSQDITKIIKEMEAEYNDMVRDLEAEIERYRNAAQSYRMILVGAELRGDMSKAMSSEFDAAERLYAKLLDK